MNPMAQPDLHPDADLLNAFVEHALSGPERALIVAHMAGCQRCREILFLAQTAAGPEIAPVTALPPEQFPNQRPGWFSQVFAKWRVALIPAAALASASAILLWFQLRPVPSRVETAKLSPQAATASRALDQIAPPAASASPNLNAGSVPRGLTPAKPNRAGQVSGREPKMTVPSAGGITEMNQLAATQDLAATPGQSRGAGPIHLDGHSASLARYAPPPEPVSPPSVTTFSAAQAVVVPPRQETANWLASAEAKGAATGTGIAPPPAAPPAPAPSPSNSVAVHGDLVSPATGGPSLDATQLQSGTELTQANGFALMRLARRAKLPSGLNSVSSAALLNRLVAVDSAGSVFFSQDAGKHWEPVRAQWGGKALVVQAPPLTLQKLETATEVNRSPVSAEVPVKGSAEEVHIPAPAAAPPSADANAAAAHKSPHAANAAAPGPDLLFKLVTDRHEVWVSADGIAWRRQ